MNECVIAIAVAVGACHLSAAAEPLQLTSDRGDHTEAAVSPDGTRVAYQLTRDNDQDIYVLDLQTGRATPVVEGPGRALYPAWSSDGQWIAYSYGYIQHTALQGIQRGFNIHVMPAKGGEPRRLTDGVVRDYLPTFGPGDEHIYFSSTRGLSASAVGIQRVPLAGGDPETVAAIDARDAGMMQPDVSPDGKLLAYSFVLGFRSAWGIRLARMDAPGQHYPLTGAELAAYGPRWSPDGTMLACTGFRVGDPGWGIYIIEVATGHVTRLDVGEGNSRSPDWLADGGELIFENNRTGSYQLYRVDLPELDFRPQAPPEPEGPEPTLVLDLSLQPEDGTVRDLSGRENHGQVIGDLQAADGALRFTGSGHVRIAEPTGFDFGTEAFSVAAVVDVEEHTGALAMVGIGAYAQSNAAWQLYLNEEGYLWFNSRDATGRFIGARSNEPLPEGRTVSVLGVRRGDGRVQLYIDGILQARSTSGADLSYGQASRVCVGAAYDGGAAFVGLLHDLQVYSGVPTGDSSRMMTLRDFLDG
ncbi:MAG: LamG-like jellyroll fold domain-containing protein [Armatimonadota bacterium]|nr:LamG-like jellyroll fold domain-containing protein [Armatimonadota bacterium]